MSHLLFKFILITLFPVCCAGQGQNHIWWFGDRAGLDFNVNPPQALTGSLFALEGTASICDAGGDLLFYTNGQSVWDRTGSVMPNGSGLTGGASSTQAAIIIPQPGSVSRYYVFTTEDHTQSGRMVYSVVDMCLREGLGDVVAGEKNIPLSNAATEKLTAVLHANERDVWVITHEKGSDRFLAFLLSAAGLDPVPVISASGTFHPADAVIGPLRASHGGDKLVCAATFYGICDMFDFDRSTGAVS